MLSIPDMAILGVLALLVFGEQKLPGIMRQAGRIMREVQNTSQSFVREMERAADVSEPPPHDPLDVSEIPDVPAEEPAQTPEPETPSPATPEAGTPSPATPEAGTPKP